MSELPRIEKKELMDAIYAPIISKFTQEIEQQKALLLKAEDTFLTYLQKLHRIERQSGISRYINESQWLKSTIHDLLAEEYPEKRAITIEEEFSEFFISTDSYLAGFENEIKVEQEEESFIPQKEDELILSTKKRFKNTFYQLSTLPKKAANWFRKEKKPIPRWSHQVPVQGIAYHYFVNELIEEILPYFKEVQKFRCQAINIKWDIVAEMNVEVGKFITKSEGEVPSEESVNALLQNIDNLGERKRISEQIIFLDKQLELWKKAIEKDIDELIDKSQWTMKKVGTLELSYTDFSEQQLKEEQSNYKKHFQQLNNGWKNTLFTQLDDFQLDLELYHIIYSSLLQYFLLQQSSKVRITRTIDEDLKEIREVFDNINRLLEKEDQDEKTIVFLLKRERRKVKFKLENETIPKAVESLYNQNIPYLLDRLEQKVKDQIDEMDEKRIIFTKNKYDAPINGNELGHFNPKEIVMLNAFNGFSEQNKLLKGKVVRQIEKLQQEIKELSGIIDYNLDSAISSTKDEIKEGKEVESVSQIAIDGIHRAQEKVGQIEESLNKLRELINKELKISIEKFTKKLLSFTDNDTTREVLGQLLKTKAIEKTKQYRKSLLKNAKKAIPLFWRFIRSKISIITEVSRVQLEKYGIIHITNELTPDLSDFLHKAEEAVEKLPYVYRRLYRIQPLEEEIFFEGRNKDLNQLQKAFENWKDGNLSSCSIIGEKGSGASSLINFFSKSIPKKKLLWHKLDQSYCSQADFIEFFRNLLKEKELNSFDEIVEHIQNSDYECIILEDLQHFFLKRINGFDALNVLFELISATAKKVFWVVEITTYTWNYLERTINIQNYFKYNILLSELDKNQLKQVILKRHRVSGYNLLFKEMSITRNESKRLKRMDEEEQQKFLSRAYFDRLYEFAQSNISLALLYWIHSTQEVTDNTIVVGKIEKMHFGFISTMDDNSIFTLHAILIHGSLNIKEHSALFHQSEKQSQMTLMVLKNNGILSELEDRYKINRLLYRQVVNALRKKNIIH